MTTTDPTGTGIITVALVDDQELVRAGLAMVVDSQPDLRVVAQAGDGDEALASPALRGADVVLMDIRMPRLDGIAATRELVGPAGGSGPKVVVLTTFDLDEHVLDAVHAGASGFLLKDSPPEVLLEALTELAAEQRDCLVMRFLQGMSIAETAAVLGRSEGAVKQLQLRGVRNLAKLMPEGIRG